MHSPPPKKGRPLQPTLSGSCGHRASLCGPWLLQPKGISKNARHGSNKAGSYFVSENALKSYTETVRATKWLSQRQGKHQEPGAAASPQHVATGLRQRYRDQPSNRQPPNRLPMIALLAQVWGAEQRQARRGEGHSSRPPIDLTRHPALRQHCGHKPIGQQLLPGCLTLSWLAKGLLLYWLRKRRQPALHGAMNRYQGLAVQLRPLHSTRARPGQSSVGKVLCIRYGSNVHKGSKTRVQR